MELEETIKYLKKEIDIQLGAFLNDKEAEGRKNNMPKEFFEAVENIRNFMIRGGKRLRPILFYQGYVLSGGLDKKEALKTAVALEFLHIGFLIHDDVMDRDSMRHSGLSIHAKYEQDYSLSLGRKDLQHFGTAMAICAGDAALAWNYEILGRANFEESVKTKTILRMSRIIMETSVGQMMDEVLQIGNNFSEDFICRVHDYKTARYTVRGPLQLGAILAGANQEELDFISRFAIPLGVAYQIKDDIIGIFEEQEKIGKPVGSDIREGKKTLLVSYALENAEEKDKKFILDKLGDKNLNREDIEKVREIMISSGSLAYSEQKINELTEEFLLNLKSDPDGFSPKYSILDNFAEFLLKRKS